MSTTSYYVDQNGIYLGGFQGANPPAGAVEVPNPPAHGLDKWDAKNSVWVVNQTILGKSSYNLAIASGVTLQSKGTPAVNGTYDISQTGESGLIGLQVAAQNNLFPGYVRDINGAKIPMTDAEFTASVAPAVLGYVLALDNALDVSNAGGEWVPPVNPVVIS